jgi:hypothetical protein
VPLVVSGMVSGTRLPKRNENGLSALGERWHHHHHNTNSPGPSSTPPTPDPVDDDDVDDDDYISCVIRIRDSSNFSSDCGLPRGATLHTTLNSFTLTHVHFHLVPTYIRTLLLFALRLGARPGIVRETAATYVKCFKFNFFFHIIFLPLSQAMMGPEPSQLPPNCLGQAQAF